MQLAICNVFKCFPTLSNIFLICEYFMHQFIIILTSCVYVCFLNSANYPSLVINFSSLNINLPFLPKNILIIFHHTQKRLLDDDVLQLWSGLKILTHISTMGIINSKRGRNSYPHFQPQKAGKQFLLRPQNSNDTVCVCGSQIVDQL